MNVLADMDEQEFVNEVYRRLQALLQKVEHSYDVDANAYPEYGTNDCETQFCNLNGELNQKPHNLDNLLVILRWLNARFRGKLVNNYNLDCEMRTFREESGLTPEVVDNLIVNARQFISQRQQASASASVMGEAHSMFRTLVVKY